MRGIGPGAAVTVAVALASVAGCSELLGIDDPRFPPEGTDGGGADASGAHDGETLLEGGGEEADTGRDVLSPPPACSLADAGGCTGSTPYCLADAGVCVACSPGARDCVGGNQPRLCNGSGAWQSETACTSGTQECTTGPGYTCQACATTASPLATWSETTPGTGPAARYFAAMAYDSLRGRVVMFGGLPNSVDANAMGDTWFLSASGWASGPTGPAARFTHAMAYDAARDEVVLFGGTDAASAILADTWVLKGSTWTKRCGPGSVACGPQARAYAAMVYDSDRQRVVMVGGDNGAAHPNPGWALSETWEWDGTSWTPACGAGGAAACPIPAVMGASIAYDARRKRVVMFGANNLPSGWIDRTWEYSAGVWTSRNDLVTLPPLRTYASLHYDSTRELVVLYGGQNGGGWLRDTWEFDGNCWKDATSAPKPPERRMVASAYDATRAKFVVYSGHDGTSTTGSVFLR